MPVSRWIIFCILEVLGVLQLPKVALERLVLLPGYRMNRFIKRGAGIEKTHKDTCCRQVTGECVVEIFGEKTGLWEAFGS